MMNARYQNVKRRQQCGVAGWQLISVVLGVIAVLAVVMLVFYPRPISEPPVVPTAPPPPPPVSKQARPDTAREVIAELKAAGDPIDYAQAQSQAQEFHAEGRLADAQLLYFFAARGGHAPAAFDLASMYDPNHYSTGTSLMDEADPFQAYKWYQQAKNAGDENAAERLEALRAWAEQAADAGDGDAERLLLTWE